jgi:hypothetical protein
MLTTIRQNLLTIPNYSPFCGQFAKCPGNWPRTKFNGRQFKCESCGWISQFEKEFIDQYKKKWDIANPHYADVSLMVSMMEMV